MVFRILLFINLILFAFYCHAAPKNADVQATQGVNLIENAGLENRLTGWTKTGSSTLTLDESTALVGKNSAVWDASAAGEYVNIGSSYNVATNGKMNLAGKRCLALVNYSWDAGTAGHLNLEV